MNRRTTAVAVLMVVLACLALVGACAWAEGQEDADASKGLTTLDWAIIALYALSTIALGAYFSRKQSTTKEYFVGGGNINPILIGVSLFATLLSTISYLSMPGEASGKGPVMILGLLAYPLVFGVVAYGLLPVYMRQRVTSAYELLETKLGLSVRLLGATMFLALRLVWMALLVYLAAKALVVMMGVEEKWVPLIVLVTGIVSVIYTSLGGLRAVVVTDFMQTVLLFGGALLVIVTVTWKSGGFGWFPTEWHANWDPQPFFSFDPKTRVTVVGTILSILAWNIATAGGDQTAVQRFMATTDVKAARRAMATQLIVGATVCLALYTVGFALLSYFGAHPGELKAGMSLKGDADKLFPHFIANQLPVGVSGLVVAAMFAAAMSSIDSGVNSITAVVLTDYLGRFGVAPKTDRGNVLFARILAFSIGVVVVLGSSLMEHIPGNITAVTSKTVNLLTTPIFGLFFFALFVRFARPVGVWLGAISGVVTAALIAFSGPIVTLLARFGVDPGIFGVALAPDTDSFVVTLLAKAGVDPGLFGVKMVAGDPVSFQWIGPAALVVNIVVGTLVSYIISRRGTDAAEDTEEGE